MRFSCNFHTSDWTILRAFYPSKKVTQHDFDRLYFFYPGFVFIKLDILGKPVYLPFDWCLICSDCFTEACVGWVNWGQYQKGRVAKLIGFYGKCVRTVPGPIHCISCFVPFLLWAYARMPTAPGPIYCTETLRNKTRSVRLFLKLKSCWISNSDAILEHLFFDIASNIITLRTFLTDNHNK